MSEKLIHQSIQFLRFWGYFYAKFGGIYT